jgi:hypothetical protein
LGDYLHPSMGPNGIADQYKNLVNNYLSSGQIEWSSGMSKSGPKSFIDACACSPHKRVRCKYGKAAKCLLYGHGIGHYCLVHAIDLPFEPLTF